jgi:hypothetical protein
MIPLRFMGAVHRLVLEGRAPELAEHYSGAGLSSSPEGDHPPPPPAVWQAFRAVLDDHVEELRTRAREPVQTNETGRSAALLTGFATVARETGLPLRLLEIGSSAGLNLRFDRYRYEQDGAGWGPPDSPVRIAGWWENGFPEIPPGLAVAERLGCDRSPIDATTEDGRLRLLSYVWPDQRERFRLIEGALKVAREVPVEIEAAGAADWLDRRLAEPRAGVVTVVFHSIVMQYVDEAEQARISALLARAGADETAGPLARVSMEPGGERTHIRVTLWPGGRERLVAEAGYHGRPVLLA